MAFIGGNHEVADVGLQVDAGQGTGVTIAAVDDVDMAVAGAAAVVSGIDSSLGAQAPEPPG